MSSSGGPLSPAPPDAGECVKVVVRCRPLSAAEAAAGTAEVVSMNVASRKVTVTDPSSVTAAAAAAAAVSGLVEDASRSFKFDCVYPQTTSQASLFTSCALPIVDSVLAGYHGTIFAYGQTGTGKTHTMEGVPTDPALAGVIPRAFERIFDAVAAAPADTEFLVRASFCEIYQEEIYDLLSPETSSSKQGSSGGSGSGSGARKKLQLLAGGGDRGPSIPGLTILPASNTQELLALLARGQRQRRTGETRLNLGSSRSHSVFTVIVESARTSAESSTRVYFKSKLNLVDLAGSERVKKSGAEGTRLDEGKAINSSLAALGKVVRALARAATSNSNDAPGDGSAMRVHIPYRDSKLTLLLRDSLGGDTKTVMIANICPTPAHLSETISTLRYAAEAAQIRNRPRVATAAAADSALKSAHDDVAILKGMLLARVRGINAETLTRDQLRVLGERGEMPSADGSSPQQPQVVVRVVETGLTEADLELALSKARLEEAALVGRTNEEKMSAAARTREAELRLARAQAVLAQSRQAAAAEEEALAAVRAELAAKQALLLRGGGGGAGGGGLTLISASTGAGAGMDPLSSLPSSSPSSLGSTAALGATAALAAAEAELLDKHQEREALAAAAAKLEEERLLADDQYATAEMAVDALKSKLRRLFAKTQGKKADAAAANEGFAAERQQLEQNIRELDKEVKLMSLVIEAYIPAKVFSDLDQARRWCPAREEWLLPGLAKSGNAQERQQQQKQQQGQGQENDQGLEQGTDGEWTDQGSPSAAATAAATGATKDGCDAASIREKVRLYLSRGGIAEVEAVGGSLGEYPDV